MADEDLRFNAVELATELTIAWLRYPNTRGQGDEVPPFLNKMHDAVRAPATEQAPAEYALRPV